MQTLQSPLLVLLLCCCLSGNLANRVYVHPFYLFAGENISCETLQDQTVKPLETLPVTPLDNIVLTPDSRDSSKLDAQRQNSTERKAVLAKLMNFLGLRIYDALSRKNSSNILLSPINTYGSLATLYLGASKKTANSFQLLLGLNRDTDREDCVSFVDGHKVLSTLQSFNSLVDDGPKDEITTQVWAFARKDAQLSEDFIQGTQDFSDTSFIRGVDFSKSQEAETLVNTFVEKTSNGKVKNVFKDLDPSSDLLFMSSFNFQGNWMTAFQPERTSLQEFHVDDTTTVMTPFMTSTGLYHYLNDKVRRCTVVKLSLSKRSHMLLVLPHEGVSLHDIESKLLTDVMSSWHQNLQEGLLELSLPKFSMSTVTDLRDLLANMNPVIETELLGSLAEFSQLSNIKPFTVNKAINKVLFEMSDKEAEPQDKKQEAGIPLKLSFNRPFFFSVAEGYFNSILILGKITNPTL
ncbi:angiotensinogen [Melanotaenia boesemani]|uniref:angiotensinogen n=1 Tax=Melanotaenia boesemani TaxID=1250792 RepID=UPI001C052241|nr:angiotensinogen [Melanotaenia boesemani]